MITTRARAQASAPPANSQTQPQYTEPPEEDNSYTPRTYDFNPVKAKSSITAGNYYFKKGKFAAAKGRYQDATLYDPGSAEAFAKLAEAEEKLHDFPAARAAYAKYFQIDPAAKDAESIKKRMEKWPPPPPVAAPPAASK